MKNLEFYEFLDKLQEDFPKLFDERPYCGFHVGPGWYQAIYDASAQIESLLDEPEDCVVAQIKEKFGELRFYVDVNNEDLYDEIISIIGEAERSANESCEECGDPGRRTYDGWSRTLCERCESENHRPNEQEE